MTPLLTPAWTRRGRRRLVVSFSGLDGAGKTRQIDALVDGLSDLGTAEVLWIPFRIWPEPLLGRLPASFRSRLGPQRRSPAVGPSSAPAQVSTGAVLRARAHSLLWTVVASIAAMSAGCSLRRRVSSSTASVLILDRYRLDSTVKLQYWYTEAPRRLLSGLVRSLAPAPDVEVLLRVDPAVAYARKPEQWTIEQLAKQAGLYEQLAREQDAVLVVDGHADAGVIADRVREAVRLALR